MKFYMTIALMATMFFQSLFAVTSAEVFAKYPNKYFVETGSYTGCGIHMAMNVGFEKIFSIELSPHHYKNCVERFAGCANVKLFFGDSSELLGFMIREIDAPATFWLDGHFSSGTTAKGETNTPLIRELDQIKNHPIKNHTILIDDIRCLNTNDFDFISLDQLLSKLKEINPNYLITYEDGYCANDVLVARVP